MKVAVIGAKGNMGMAICDAIEAADDFELVARVDIGDDIKAIADNQADVAVDFTVAAAAMNNLKWLAMHNIDAVVGTTGFSDSDIEELQRAFESNAKRCFLVPNFSIGAVLLMRCAEMAAPYFDGVEVIELHHDNKRDAPSGTARLTARKIAAARTEPWADDPTEVESPQGVRGGLVDGVRVHSIRLRGLLAHEEVIFGGVGQTLTLRHDSYDRAAFMPGVLLALRQLRSLPPGLTTGLETVL